MKLLLTVGFMLVLACTSKADPECHTSELFKCLDIAINYLHTLPKRSIPVTEDEVNGMCTEIGKAVDCAFSFRDRCMTPLQKEVLQLVVEGALDLQKDFCSPGSPSSKKYLAHSECLNKVSQMDIVKEQIEYVMAVLEQAQNVKPQDAITYACCGYGKVSTTFLNLGEETCGTEAKDTALELLGFAVAQLPEVICSGYTGKEDRCVAVLPPEGSKPSDAAKQTGVYKFVRDILKNWLD